MKVHVQRSCSKCEGSGIDESLASDNPTNPPLCARCGGLKTEMVWIPLQELFSALKAIDDSAAAASLKPQVVEVPAV
jgi:NAD-dependent SIR2 family protein deacetylase